MSNQPMAHGLSAIIKKKLQEKRSAKEEEEVTQWMEAVLECKLDRSIEYEDCLYDGVVLCKVINKIVPGSVKKINTNTVLPFKIMENINSFHDAIKQYGVPVLDMFQTVDLFEKKDISAVTRTIYALGRICQTHPEYSGPTLGPKITVAHA